MKYHLITLGCQMNVSDSERVKTILEDKLGYQWTDDEQEAGLLGILACSVRQKAIDKVYSRIHAWNKQKNKRHLITFVSGCILAQDKERFLKLFDLVFSMRELPQLPEMLSQYGIANPAGLQAIGYGASEMPGMGPFWNITPHYESRFEAYIPIQNGCDKFCTFCAVPYTRGREVSRPSEEILAEVQSLVEQGYRSITLLGQNVNSYGLDKKGAELRFPELLQAIGEIGRQSGQDFWTYFTSPHPRDMGDDVIDVIAAYPVLAKQLHLPIQSGDDEVLVRMNRKHNIERYRQIVSKIRSTLPNATLFTDIIVGFTGETDAQFANTMKAMEEFRYHMAYIAMYSPRPGAASSRWADDIPHDVKKERYHVLSSRLAEISHDHLQEMIGKTYKVLVRGKDRKAGYLSGMTEGRIVLRFPSEDEQLIGQFVYVTIDNAADFSAEGKLAETPQVIEHV